MPLACRPARAIGGEHRGTGAIYADCSAARCYARWERSSTGCGAISMRKLRKIDPSERLLWTGGELPEVSAKCTEHPERAEQVRKWKAERVRNGKCCNCKNDALPGLTYCDACAERQRAWKSARVVRGVCTSCPAPARPGMTMCAECGERRRKRRANKVARGVCENCGGAARRGKRTCGECAKRRRERRVANVQSGKCVDCSREASPGRTNARTATRGRRSRTASAGKT